MVVLKKFLSKHPLVTSIISDSIVAILYSYVIEPLLLNKLEKLVFKITIYRGEKAIHVFDFNIVGIILLIAIIALIPFLLFSAHKRKNAISNAKRDEDRCEQCDIVKELRSSNKELETELQEAKPYKKIIDKLSEYANSAEVIDSIQLFAYSSLPEVTNISELDTVNLTVKFLDGIAKEKSNTNVLFNIQYHFDQAVYNKIKRAFDLRNEYFVDLKRAIDKEKEDEIQKKACEAINLISEMLNALKTLDQIKDTHYACYRMLEILTNVVLYEEKAVECRRLLECEECIEKQLKSGQRTGILGTMFTNKMYCFYNENSTTKKDRIYFTAPLISKKEPLILLVAAQKSKIKTSNTIDYLDCCEQIYSEIKQALTA